jgi:hypothetical protein
MINNCGFLTSRWYDVNCPNLSPSIESNHIPYFHSLMCEWAYDVALSFFWVVVIDAQNKNHLMNSILDVSNIEPTLKGKWDISQNETNALFNDRTQNTIGCIFADSVRIPGESTNITSIGGSKDRGGHLGGTGASGRTTLTSLDIGFRETNLSFTEFFIRPWNIVTSYKGLIADDGGLSSNSNAKYWGGSIKSNIHLYQLATSNGGNCSSSVIRKQFHFYDAVPISIESDEMSQADSGVNKRQVSFTYNYYTVGKGNANA